MKSGCNIGFGGKDVGRGTELRLALSIKTVAEGTAYSTDCLLMDHLACCYQLI